MENSVLSDAAGVQKNISKMYEEYAQKIGKTTDSLTQAEKAQAVYNGIMDEAAMFTGSAAEMANGYQGVQAQLNATNLELSRTIGESMVPVLTQYSSLQLSITKSLTEFIKNHKNATSGVITFTTVLLAGTVAVIGIRKAIIAYTKATGVANSATTAFSASLLANPLFLGTLAISVGIAALEMYVSKMEETIEKTNQEIEKSKELSEIINNFWNSDNNEALSEADKGQLEQEKKQAEEILKIYEEKNNKILELEKERGETSDIYRKHYLQSEIDEANNELKKFKEQNMVGEKSIEDYKTKIDALNKTLATNAGRQAYATATNQKAHRETLINIAQTKADIKGKQELLNILKKGETTTEEYSNAKSQLVKVYPELAKVNENTINSTQAAIDEESRLADVEWANAQVAIQASILEVSAMMSNSEQIRQICIATKQSVEEVTASLQNQIDILGNLAKLTPDDFKGSVTSNYTPKTSSSKSSSSYSNKALDNYKKQIEHKKALDQISLKEEIAMYETALNKYAKTTDEKMELREKIYDLNKELAQKEKELLEQQTEDYETYIQEQKNLKGAAYDVKEQTQDYDKIIKMHKNYLNQIMKDERLSLDERKQIYREELQTIRDYEQQKRDLRVEAVDNTVSQLTNVITKQLEEMQKKDKDFIDEQIEQVEKLKEIRINAINAEYDAKIEAIEKELAALDKAEEQKTRDEEDAEYEKKKKRLEELVAFEHDAVTKANYQKELDKLIAEYQKTLDKRALDDKKEALNEQKDLLKEEQDNKVQAIEDESEKQKEVYNKQLTELEEYYDKQIDMAQETAEQMLLNVEKNQDQILYLLKTYGNKYEITGQTLGEKLAQGINDGLSNKIQNVIQRIQDTIDSNIESKIKEWTASNYKYKAGSNKPNTTSVNVIQNNYIEQNPEMPSETYRKLNNVSRNLATEFAGM